MPLIETVIGWFEYAESHAATLLALSLVTLIGSFLVFPIVIMRLPQNYFVDNSRPPPLSRFLPVHWFLMAIKNLIGLALVLIGFLLLFLPGQGLLTLIIGLTIMNYPGKFAIERWLVRRPRVMPALNWLRERFGKESFVDP